MQKLEDIAQCYASSLIIESEFTIKGDYKNESQAKKVSSFFSDRFEFYANLYDKGSTGIRLNLITYAQNKYNYMGDIEQLKYALAVQKDSKCKDEFNWYLYR